MGFGLPMKMKPAVRKRDDEGAWGYCDICSEFEDAIDIDKMRWLVAWDKATRWDYCQDCVNDALTADRILVITGNLMNMRHPRGCKDIPLR